MLRNKYLIAVLGGLLLVVLIYNVSFFSRRGKGTNRPFAVPGNRENINDARTSPASAQSPEGGGAGEWRRDPFWYPGGRPHAAPPAAKKGPGLHLEAVMGKGAKAYAIINSDIVGVGERSHGYVVEEIGDHFVKLKGPRGTKTLKLAGDSGEKE